MAEPEPTETLTLHMDPVVMKTWRDLTGMPDDISTSELARMLTCTMAALFDMVRSLPVSGHV